MARKILGLNDPGDSSHFGSTDIDKINQLLTGTDQSATDAVTTNTQWTFTKAIIDSGLNTIKQAMGFDAYVYIDSNDSNKIKGRINRTGTVYSDPTNADTVINAVINDLSANSTQSIAAGASQFIWTGGNYGSIFFGPGTFNINNSVVVQSNILLSGCGPGITRLKLVAQHADNSNSTVIKGSQWDTLSAPNHPNATQLMEGDKNIQIMNMTIDGNRINNQNTITTTQSTQIISNIETVTQSWGHGIAIFGSGIYLSNLWVQFCRGAGIVLQNNDQNNGGITGTSPTALERHDPAWPLKIRDVAVVYNDQQGILARAVGISIKGITTYYNGEIGIDAQTSAYFAGRIWDLSDGIMFLDCNNHVNDSFSTYNPLLAELRCCGGGPLNVHDMWIEGPNGPGDNIHLGSGTGSNAFNANGDQLQSGGGYAKITDVQMDNIHYNGIYIGPNWGNVNVSGTRIRAQNDLTSSAFQNGVMCLSKVNGGNRIEFTIEGLPNPSDLTNHHSAIVMGDASNITYQNSVKVTTIACQYDLKWGNAGSYDNNVEIIHCNDLGNSGLPASVGLIDPASASIDYTRNNIKALVVGNPASAMVGFMDSNGGLATFSGNGSSTTFTITHGLYATPNVVNVVAKSPDALGPFYVTTPNATTIVVNYGLAPPSGSSNIALWWQARVNPQ